MRERGRPSSRAVWRDLGDWIRSLGLGSEGSRKEYRITMRKRRKATIATVASLASAMVVTVAGAGVTNTPFNPQFGGLGSPNGGALAGSQVIYENKVTGNTATQSNWDWTAPDYAWGDDIHFKDNDTAGWVITALNYAYLNQGKGQFTVTHTVVIYEMDPASGSHKAGTIAPLPVLSIINIPSLAGTGAFTVSITGLSIQAGHAVWITLDESPGNAGRTFWLTGGTPNTGFSHDTLLYSNLDGGFFYIVNLPLGGDPLGNIAVTVSGFKIPGPSVIALLGLSGLVTLSRRRRK